MTRPLYKNKFFLTQKYVHEGYSAGQIAQAIFSSKSAVTAALARFEIPIREAHLHHGHPSQAKFGEKIRKGTAVVHLVEQRVVDTVKNLKAEGLSRRKIAEILDQMKVPTKQRGKKWHPEMVKRILGPSA
ncbi:MAG: recombinase family protein [Deltaproteobacteria bacterium]|nr:recombinase family protein [Deltaproteobacteria bacterium]